MEWFLLIITGLAVSLDAFFLSMVISVTARSFGFAEYKMPVLFGFAHVVMICVGFFLSTIFFSVIDHVDHWVAFALLSFLGIRMMVSASHKYEDFSWSSVKNSLLLVLATSIDALAIGVAFTVIGENIFFSSLSIGLIVMLVSFLGLFFGYKIHFFKKKQGFLFGGLVLIGIGVKILLGHLF